METKLCHEVRLGTLRSPAGHLEGVALFAAGEDGQWSLVDTWEVGPFDTEVDTLRHVFRALRAAGWKVL